MNRRDAIRWMVVAPVAMALPGQAAEEAPKPIMWEGRPCMAIKKTLIIDQRDYRPNGMYAYVYITPMEILGRSREAFEAALDVELRRLKRDILRTAEKEYGLGKEAP